MIVWDGWDCEGSGAVVAGEGGGWNGVDFAGCFMF